MDHEYLQTSNHKSMDVSNEYATIDDVVPSKNVKIDDEYLTTQEVLHSEWQVWTACKKYAVVLCVAVVVAIVAVAGAFVIFKFALKEESFRPPSNDLDTEVTTKHTTKFASWTTGYPSVCPDGFMRESDLHSCYMLVPGAFTWNDGRHYCSLRDAFLVEINDDREMERIKQRDESLFGTDERHYWTGGRENITEPWDNEDGVWIWDSSRQPLPLESTLWFKGRPNDYPRGEDHVEVIFRGNWDVSAGLNDAHARSKFNIICETKVA